MPLSLLGLIMLEIARSVGQRKERRQGLLGKKRKLACKLTNNPA